MSFRAIKFVRQLRGLTPEEKAVAFVIADHDDHRSGKGSWPSMTTVAEEAGLENRETASRITKRLFAEKKILLADNPSRGRKPTVYRFNYDLSNCDSTVTVSDGRTVISESRLNASNRDLNRDSATSNRDFEPVENAPTVTLEGYNRDSPVTGRVGREKKERENLEGEEGEVRSTSTPAVEAEVRTAFELLRIPPFGSWEQKCDWTAFVSTANGLPVTALLEAFFQSRKNRGLRIGKEWTEVKRAWERRQAREAIQPEQQGRSRPSGALHAEPGKYANRKPDFSGD